MAAAGLVGMVACYRAVERGETTRGRGLARYVGPLTLVILAILVCDLFIYRGVPAARAMAAGRVGADWLLAFGVTGWKRPFAQATSFLLTVWHATMLGILISGLTLSLLPAYLERWHKRAGLTGSVCGAVLALPHPFCSCCASVMAPSLARRGASTAFMLAFVVGAPMLNVTTIVLALALLPPPFALTRIGAGVVVTVLVTNLAARLADGTTWTQGGSSTIAPPTGPFRRLTAAYLRVFDRLEGGITSPVNTSGELLRAWMRASGRIALLLVPALWLWSVLASAIFDALPATFGNNLPSVVMAAVAGTFFMISTWSEIPMALQLIQAGSSAPAAALLVVLPAISLPCMMFLGASVRRFRAIAFLAAGVIVSGIIVGSVFL
jgi:uncharacterized membrane protein YraQ (UPF0718 family)